MNYQTPEITKKMQRQAENLIMNVLKNGNKANIKTDINQATQHIANFYSTVLKRKKPPKNIEIVSSPGAAIKSAMIVTNSSRKDIIKQLIFINLWTYWPTRAWAALHIRKVDPKKEKIRDDIVQFTNEKFEMSKDIHAIICCSDTCFVVEFPKVFSSIYDNKNFKMHRDGGLAIEYLDGTGFAYLNGVEVPDWLACTPVDELNTAKVMAITNVDVRREGLARIPNDKKIKDLNSKTIDSKKAGKQKWLHFKLLDVDFKDGRTRRIFRAFDPSSKAYIFERVEDNIDKALDAAAWRDGEKTYIIPEQRT